MESPAFAKRKRILKRGRAKATKRACRQVAEVEDAGDSSASDASPLQPSSVSLVFPEDGAKCPEGHAYRRRTENPPGYKNRACCDMCGLPDLSLQRGDFFHCRICKFDQCPECVAVAVRYQLSAPSGGSVEVHQEMNVENASAENHHARVWTSAPALSRYLEELCEETTASVAGSQRPLVLELGAGSALVSAVLAKMGRHGAVMATDLAEALPLATDTVRRNFAAAVEGSTGCFTWPALADAPEQRMFVRSLDWMRAKEGVETLREEAIVASLPPPSLIVAADVAYDHDLVVPFLDTLVALRDEWVHAASGDTAKATLLIAHERRGMGVDPLFMKGLRKRGICVERVGCSRGVLAEGRGRVEILRAEL